MQIVSLRYRGRGGSARLAVRQMEVDLGRSLPVLVTVRANPRARRMVIRIPPGGDGVVLTLPLGVGLGAARRFVREKAGWICEILAEERQCVTLVDGATIPFRDMSHTIRHDPIARGAIRLEVERSIISVPGDPGLLEGKLRRWLKCRARAELEISVARYARILNVRPGRISVRDTRSRWGSCAASGALSFSWRLIFAPSWVLDYVAAHEVAHLREMNHGPRFWALVADLTPEMETARCWLRDRGAGLHRIAP